MAFQYKGWTSFSLYYSADYSRDFLKKCYQRLHLDNADQKSFENCYPFIYYLEHGKIYYQQAAVSPIHIQPILLFYGLVHLVKACILTVNPNYPETTSVLAHGLTTRKRKKQQYSFMDDEVKLQKHGLFPLMAEKLFHMKQLEGEKIKMGEILQFIPELSFHFSKLTGRPTFLKIDEQNGDFFLSKNILDIYHMTDNRFKDYLGNKAVMPLNFQEQSENHLVFKMDHAEAIEPTPLKYNYADSHFSLPLNRGELYMMPELMLHYLLLYNLGMIARYEIDWWSELIKMMPNEDYPFIESFLGTTLQKGPYLIYRYLEGK
ncbi:YaaC-like Protein [Mesobacillus persicus]|uniref:YaaC-like Protein n=1 Tax=Mesobacillus persicus TaxID=930146 RepID=A0A1H8KS42_9BACI|nr:YaaC family protein [Mesobacillus persicus]SEN95228.1 YaaC-like Protein [Mesobacillus persicus]